MDPKSSIREALNKQCADYLDTINIDDYKFFSRQLTMTALQAIFQKINPDQIPSVHIGKSLSGLDKSLLKKIEQLKKRLNQFVSLHSVTINSLLQSRIPFSNLSESFSLEILSKAMIENHYMKASTVLEELLIKHSEAGTLLPGNNTWEEFEILLEKMAPKSVGKAMQALYRLSEISNSVNSGYCLLSLIKLFLHLPIPLPPKQECNFDRVKTCIRSFLKENRTIPSFKR